jgi:protocatechuate 3,4-dioxygenase beta subunit
MSSRIARRDAVLIILTGAIGGLGCGSETPTSPDGSARSLEPIVGLPCEGCEAVFQGLPSELTTISRIASPDEPGEPMRIEGVVTDRSGRPAPGIVVYGYHTNAHGVYPTDDRFRGLAAHRHGRLRGWVRTSQEGRYQFDTIRPVGYPNTDLPAHVHMHILEVGRGTYYIDDIMFTDDPRLTDAAIRQLTSGRGGNGVATPRRTGSGYAVTRDIVLGDRIPGYPG